MPDGSDPPATSGSQPGPIDPTTGEPVNPYQGLGPLLEEDDATVFKTIHELVLRQEVIAKNHLEQDKHWTRVKLGYPWSELKKDDNKDTYKAVLPYGTGAYSVQAVPNKSLDLVNKASEALLVDFAQPQPKPLDDSEEAQGSASMADKFLTQDGGVNGTNDQDLWYRATDKALTCASSYVHVWTDPTGNGSVPLQIKAHPQAVSPDNPLVGPDGMPTVDYILRYVTPTQQFTDDPTQAAPQWLPRLRADVLGREHIRVFPESRDVRGAEKVILLWYETVGELKRRLPETVGQMDDDEIKDLCDWTPPRYLVLLPPFQRTRWKLSNGTEHEKSGTNDERIIFFYWVYQRATPEHPKGAELILSGANTGTSLDKKLLSFDAEVTSSDGSGPKKDPRSMKIPVAQVRPRSDADERDPSGTHYIGLFGGANEFNATLATNFLEAIDQILHPVTYIPSTSPVEGWQITEARASGDHITILSPNDKPTFGQVNPLPAGFLDVMAWGTNQVESIASINKPLQGSNDQQEVSGVARQIAVQEARIGLNRMQQAVNGALEDYWDIKLERCQRDFHVPQQLRFVGEDGAYKQEEFSGENFSLVGEVSIQTGTGTMMAPEAKVGYAGELLKMGLLSPADAADAARPTYADTLGLPDSPHQQFVERSIAAWNKGPTPQWLQAQQQYVAQMQQYQQLQQQTQQTLAAVQQQHAQGNMVPPPPMLPPPPPAPWSPFAPRPNDGEMQIASIWANRLSQVISSVKFDTMPPPWQQVLVDRYTAAMTAIQPPPQLPPNFKITAMGDPSTIAADEAAAVQGMTPQSIKANTPPPPPPPGSPPAPQPPHPPSSQLGSKIA